MMKEVSKRTSKRVLALVLVFTMLLGMPGLTVLAAPGDPTPAAAQPELRLWYDEPASQTGTPGSAGAYSPTVEDNIWQQDTLPIGNGTIGASVYGEIATERLALNEQTLWLGGPSESRPNYMGGNVVSGKGENGQTLKDIVAQYVENGTITNTNKMVGDAEWGDGGYGYYAPWGELNIAYDSLPTATQVYAALPGATNNGTDKINTTDFTFSGSWYTWNDEDGSHSGPAKVEINGEGYFTYSFTVPEGKTGTLDLCADRSGGGGTVTLEFTQKPSGYTQAAVDAVASGGLLKSFSNLIPGDYTVKGTRKSGKVDLDYVKLSYMTGYQRWLSLDNAIAGVEFTMDGVNYTREYFVSHPDNVLVSKLASTGGAMNLTITLPGRSESTGTNNTKVQGNDTLALCGAVADNQLKFASYVKAVPTGGSVAAGSDGKSLVVTGATEVVLYFTAATDYKQVYPHYRTGETDEALAARVKATLDAAVTKGYVAVKNRHLEDYYALYNRMNLDLGQVATTKTTDVLLRAYNAGTATEGERRLLEVMLFQYGRYLTIASSREDSQLPSNLQGIWNRRAENSPWHADFHTNVNLQMNYWPVYVTNLAESADPLIRYIDSLREPGRVTAKVYAGIESSADNPNGFMAHTQNTPFGWTCPGWSFSWGWSPAAIAWMLQNCWEHYEYTGDLEYMRREIYPMMREYCRLYDQLLIDANTGKVADELPSASADVQRDAVLVSIPSYSPEHGPATAGNTYEHSLIWQLYEDTMTAATLLGVDDALVGDKENPAPGTWAYNQAHLRGPIEIGEGGQIKEWYHEVGISKDANGNTLGEGYGHRHLSHMLGLYPGDLVQMNEEWVEAARVSMENRTDESTGWGMGQRINTWARLRDGNKALKLIGDLFNNGIYVNLWDAHPPFQIDGNFGYTSGVAEMLMQSNMGFIDLLPALPDDWTSGSFQGLVTRGNFELDATWQNNSLTSVDILSKNGGECVVAYSDLARAKITDASGAAIPVTVVSGDKVSFQTVKGQTYHITDIPQPNVKSVSGAAYCTQDDTVEVKWDAENGKTYTIYRQVEDGDILPLTSSASGGSYTDNAAYDALGHLTYYIAEGSAASTLPIALQDLRNMGRVDDQYSLDGTSSTGSPIVYGGNWGTYNSESNNYKGTSKFVEAGNVNGQTATLTFLGTGIQAMGKINGYGTEFTMTVDGGTPQSFTVSGSSGNNKVMGEITGLTYGVHTVVFTLTKNKVDFDGFNVLGGQAPVNPEEPELEISTVGGVEKLWGVNETVKFTANLEGVTWSASTKRAEDAHATTCIYPEHKFSWDSETQTLTAGLTDEVVTVTATKGSKRASMDITITPRTTVTIIEDSLSSSAGRNPAITWDGSWSPWWGEQQKHHGGSKTENGTSFTYTFTGTGIAVFSQKNGDSSWSSNSMTVVLDEGKAGAQTVNCSTYDSTLAAGGTNQQKLAEFLNLTNGEHTIKVSGSGTGVNLDFLEVYAPNPNAPQANLEALKTAVANAAEYQETSYTEESWAPLAAALVTAGKYLNNTETATQAQVDSTAAAIQTAIGNLVAKPLDVPANLRVILTEGTAITLKWDAVPGATGYTVTANGKEYAAAATTYRVSGLDSGKTYNFTVKAANATQASEPVSSATLDVVAPTAPTNLSYSAGTLSWTASTDNKAVIGYKVLVDGVEQSDKSASTTRTVTVADGKTVQVIAFDAAANESVPAVLLVAQEFTVTAAGGATITGNKSTFKVGEAVQLSVVVPKGKVLTGWSSEDVTLSGGTGNTVTFAMPAQNVTVTANVESKNWTVTTNLTNLTSNAPSTVGHYNELSLTLTASGAYRLPSTIQVTMGGEELNSTHYRYNTSNGNLVIPEVTGNVVITAANADQIPTGTTFTQSDPFQLPSEAGVVAKAEAEYMTATGATVSAGPGFGNKHLGSFTNGNKVGLYYNAPVAGIYTATLTYRSSRVATNLHTFGWTGTKVADYAAAAIQNTLNDSGVGVYMTVQREFEVLEEGTGLVEFTVGNVGNDSFDLDCISFELDAQAGPAVTSVTVEPAEATIYTNQGENTTKLTATILPEEAAGATLTWSSSDRTIAAVDQDGNVTAHANGTVTITAAARNGKRGTATVNVKTKVSGTVTISGTPKFDQVLEASVNQLTPEAARGYLNYQWKRDGEPINGATERTYQAVKEDIDTAITVTVTVRDPYVGSENGYTTSPVTVSKADGIPVSDTLASVDCVSENDDDGQITGLDCGKPHEYKLVSGSTWITVEAGESVITGLTPGDYHVRHAATDTHTAGPASRNLTVLAHGVTAYDVNLEDSFDGGVVRATPRKATAAATVTLTVIPDEGYKLTDDSLSVTYVEADETKTITPTSGSDGTYTFAMPAADVTVTAEFEKITFELEHSLTNITCTMTSHTVDYGAKPEITLTPDDGYNLPDTITITNTDDSADIFLGYTYRGGVITFTQPITKNLTITGAGVQKQYRVAYYLTGVTAIGQPRGVNHNEALHIELSPADSEWELPEKAGITITVNGTAYTDFTYENGAIDIGEDVINGHVEVTVVGQAAGPAVAGVRIIGQAIQGRELTAMVEPSQAVARYQWLWVNEDGTETSIPGANKPRYTLSTQDVGKTLRVRATGVSPYIGTKTSADFGPVAEAAVVEVTGVELDKTSVTVLGGSAVSLVATVLPENATNKTVRWSVDDSSIIEVNAYGVVRGLAAGAANVTVTTVNGEKTATCAVEVVNLILAETSASLKVGETVSLNVSVSSLLSSQAVTWTSSDEEIATVDDKGVVTGVAAGTATITVETVVGNLSAQCEVRVSTPGSSSGGGGGGGGYVPPKTETREDGATVTTVTKSDGTQIKTVEQTDGAKMETVVAKNGQVTLTVTDPEGEVIAKVEIPAQISGPAIPFTDVPKDHWANKAVENMAGLGLIKGVGGNLFDTGSPMTRGSLATILHRLSQGKSDYNVTFKDVAQGKYYTEGVAWAAKVGVVKGMTDELFAPTQVITREQLAVMLCRYAKLIGMDTTAGADALDAFPDKAKVGAWAADGVAWCVENGILKGKGQVGLDPASDVSRVEVAVMLDRFLTLIG